MQRYTDNVPMILDQFLVLVLDEALAQGLISKLPLSGPNAADECEKLLRPSEAVVEQKQELEARRAHLEKARREFKAIWAA
jgi:hypothetical protein